MITVTYYRLDAWWLMDWCHRSPEVERLIRGKHTTRAGAMAAAREIAETVVRDGLVPGPKRDEFELLPRIELGWQREVRPAETHIVDDNLGVVIRATWQTRGRRVVEEVEVREIDGQVYRRTASRVETTDWSPLVGGRSFRDAGPVETELEIFVNQVPLLLNGVRDDLEVSDG